MTITANQPTTIANGLIAISQGFEFIVRNIRYKGKAPNGQEVWSYAGVCTSHQCNDSIRYTPYNGGRYTWRPGEPLKNRPDQIKIDRFTISAVGEGEFSVAVDSSIGIITRKFYSIGEVAGHIHANGVKPSDVYKLIDLADLPE